MERLLEKLYYDLSSPATYSGVSTLYREAKKLNRKVKVSDVEAFLKKQYVYSMHKPARRNFEHARVIVPGPSYQFQMDLSDMQNIKQFNDGFQYLVTCIDVFSKYAWAIPVRNKSGDEIVRAFKLIGRKPQVVQTDEGKEFLNKKFQALLQQIGIRFFTSKNRLIKCAVVERFNRTLKNKIYKHFSVTRKYRYLEALPKILDSYNNSYHRSIKMKPREVGPVNVAEVRDNLYGKLKTRTLFKFELDDRVRVSSIKKTFEKGYLPNWSEEIFKIKKRLPLNVPAYELQDLKGEAVEGLFYEEKLQKVLQDKYWIEKVIKRGKTKSLVKWYGYSDKFNTWVSNKDIKQHG